MEKQTTTEVGKSIFDYMKANDMIKYGAVITGDEVRNIIGSSFEDIDLNQDIYSIKNDINQITLFELSSIDYVRNILLGMGMALSMSKGDYQILLPSQNSKYIERYMASADKKLKRALKLSRSLDTEKGSLDYETNSRIIMKREAIASEKRRRKNIS